MIYEYSDCEVYDLIAENIIVYIPILLLAIGCYRLGCMVEALEDRIKELEDKKS